MDTFCVGLVTDFGSVSEGIRREAWLALQDARSRHVADRIDRIETVDVRDRAANISVFADSEYDVIVTVGSSISAETTAAAHRYPGLLFISVGQPSLETISNLTKLVFHEERSGFLAGALAAMITRTGRIAAVCEAGYIDPVRRYCDGFRAGAQYAKEDVQVIITYRDGPAELLFHDRAWAEAAAAQQVKQGADVVFAAGGETADAVLEAAARDGAFVIGTETDLYGRLPAVRPRLVASAVSEIRSGVLELMGFAREGGVHPGEYWGRVGLAPFHELGGYVSSEAQARILAIQSALLDGSLHLEIPYEAP